MAVPRHGLLSGTGMRKGAEALCLWVRVIALQYRKVLVVGF